MPSSSASLIVMWPYVSSSICPYSSTTGQPMQIAHWPFRQIRHILVLLGFQIRFVVGVCHCDRRRLWQLKLPWVFPCLGGLASCTSQEIPKSRRLEIGSQAFWASKLAKVITNIYQQKGTSYYFYQTYTEGKGNYKVIQIQCWTPR